LKFLNFVKHAQGRFGCWNLLLSGYKYLVEHIKGHKNILADRINQIELPTDTSETAEDVEDRVADIGTIADVSPNYDLHDRSDHI